MGFIWEEIAAAALKSLEWNRSVVRCCRLDSDWIMAKVVVKINDFQKSNKLMYLQRTRRTAVANGTCVSFCNRTKAHFGLPWDNRGKCHTDEKRIQCLSNASQHAIFNRFPVIQPVSSKVRHFSTFCLPWVLPWDNRGKCYIDGKRIQCWSNA